MNVPFHPVYFLVADAHHAPAQLSLWDTIVQSNFLNFIIAAAALIFIFQRFKLFSILDKRQEKVVRELKEAEEKREKALKELEAIEKRTAQLTSEVEALLKDAEQTAEQLSQSIIRNAEEEAAKIISSAEKRIALEQKTASRELEQRLMHEAIYAARQLLENTLTEEDKHRSVEDFVTSLPELHQKELQR